jgi:hypothetical protein
MFMSILQEAYYTDFESKAILRRKTGKKTKIVPELLLARQLLNRCLTRLKLARRLTVEISHVARSL